jgi:2-polyprenyl-3-methyl-5-hydroxy-6-metoxy-1,4-benzoquinol methylase
LERDLAAPYKRLILYQEIEHPWFRKWPVHRSTERVVAIHKYLAKRNIHTALDVGGCTGRIARELVRIGASRVTVLETDCAVSTIGMRLAEVFGMGYAIRYVWGDVREWLGDKGPWDVATVLSLFHHWLKTDADLKTLRSVLKMLGDKALHVILDLPRPDEDWTKSLVPLDKLNDLYREVLPEHQVKELGVHDGRRMLAFKRKRCPSRL